MLIKSIQLTYRRWNNNSKGCWDFIFIDFILECNIVNAKTIHHYKAQYDRAWARSNMTPTSSIETVRVNKDGIDKFLISARSISVSFIFGQSPYLMSQVIMYRFFIAKIDGIRP